MHLPRVLSYPPRHPFIDRLNGTVATFVYANEPMPTLPHFYDIAWLREHANDWDVVHFHFGWEQYTPSVIADVVAQHIANKTPIVVTVHDTRSPHTDDPQLDQQYLSILLGAASHTTTLTKSAALHIQTTYSQAATVIPHGPLLTKEEMTRCRLIHESVTPTIYVHVKEGRTNLDWKRLLRMAPNIERKTGYALEFGVRMESEAHAYIETLSATSNKYVTLQEALSHDVLCAKIARASALLLPYAWGSHSGMIELALDVGTPTIVYDTGHYKDQHPSYLIPFDAIEERQERIIISVLQRLGEIETPPSIEDRLHALATFKRGYRNIYRKVLSHD